jgi:protein gp37
MFGTRSRLERIGKKAAGRNLDGRTHDEFPK